MTLTVGRSVPYYLTSDDAQMLNDALEAYDYVIRYRAGQEVSMRVEQLLGDDTIVGEIVINSEVQLTVAPVSNSPYKIPGTYEYLPQDRIADYIIAPDCEANKHQACDGKAYDMITDMVIVCPCGCHL